MYVSVNISEVKMDLVLSIQSFPVWLRCPHAHNYMVFLHFQHTASASQMITASSLRALMFFIRYKPTILYSFKLLALGTPGKLIVCLLHLAQNDYLILLIIKYSVT